MITRSIGRVLRPVRAGMHKTAWFSSAVRHAPNSIAVTSAAFDDGAAIPQRYAGHGVGENISPPLAWSAVPPAAVELVLLVEDPDAPLPRPVVHALAFGIDPQWHALAEGAINPGAPQALPHLGTGSFGRRGYGGPRPVPGHGTHRYLFQLLALDSPSGIDDDATLGSALSTISGRVLARGLLTGTYRRD